MWDCEEVTKVRSEFQKGSGESEECFSISETLGKVTSWQAAIVTASLWKIACLSLCLW